MLCIVRGIETRKPLATARASKEDTEFFGGKLARARANAMILDVGCGVDDKTNVIQRSANIIHVDIDPRAFHLETRCDARLLPFKDKSFTVTLLSHVLEHVFCPVTVLREANRVTTTEVIVHVPNNNQTRHTGEDPDHNYSWTPTTLTTLLKHVYPNVTINQTTRTTPRNNNPAKRLILTTINTLTKPNQITATCTPTNP